MPDVYANWLDAYDPSQRSNPNCLYGGECGAPIPPPVTEEFCQRVQCGVWNDQASVPGGTAAVLACSQQYGGARKAICDPMCEPFWPDYEAGHPGFEALSMKCRGQIPQPAPVTNMMISAAAPELPRLTPSSIVQPLPDISRALAPVPVPEQDCSLWCNLNQAIQDNAGLAIAILAGATLVMCGRRRTR